MDTKYNLTIREQVLIEQGLALLISGVKESIKYLSAVETQTNEVLISYQNKLFELKKLLPKIENRDLKSEVF